MKRLPDWRSGMHVLGRICSVASVAPASRVLRLLASEMAVHPFFAEQPLQLFCPTSTRYCANQGFLVTPVCLKSVDVESPLRLMLRGEVFLRFEMPKCTLAKLHCCCSFELFCPLFCSLLLSCKDLRSSHHQYPPASIRTRRKLQGRPRHWPRSVCRALLHHRATLMQRLRLTLLLCVALHRRHSQAWVCRLITQSAFMAHKELDICRLDRIVCTFAMCPVRC